MQLDVLQDYCRRQGGALTAYARGDNEIAAQQLRATAEEARRLGREEDYWFYHRKAGNALLWAGNFPEGLAILYHVATQPPRMTSPGSAYCAMTDIIYAALDFAPLAEIESLMRDTRRFILEQNHPEWESRLLLMQAMLAGRRGDHAGALRGARTALERYSESNIPEISQFTYVKWIARSAFHLGDAALVTDTVARALRLPVFLEFETMRQDYLRVLDQRLLRHQQHRGALPLFEARRGLEFLRLSRSRYDERFAFLQVLLHQGAWAEFQADIDQYPPYDSVQTHLLSGDYHLARYLATRGGSLPDWELWARDADVQEEPEPRVAPEPSTVPAATAPAEVADDPAHAAALHAAHRDYARAAAHARTEDARLQCRNHWAQVQRRWRCLRLLAQGQTILSPFAAHQAPAGDTAQAKLAPPREPPAHP